MARTLVVGVVGAVGAVILAVALSPIAPLGEARLAEDSTGLAFDTFVLALGAFATVMIVLLLGVWPALRGARAQRADGRAARSRPSTVVAQLVSLGAPPTAVIGCPQCPGAPVRRVHRPVGLRPLGHGAGRGRLVRDGGLRVQPHAPDHDTPSVGRPRAGQLRPDQRCPIDEPGAQPGGDRDHRRSRQRERHDQREDCRGHRRDGRQGFVAVLDGRRPPAVRRRRDRAGRNDDAPGRRARSVRWSTSR